MSATLEQRLVTKYKNASTEAERDAIIAELAPIKAAELRGRMSPRGGIPGLHPVLDERRFIYGIPDGAFRVQAAFNVCLVWQVGRYESDKIGDTGLYMAQTTKKRIDEETPRGILVSAGMEALDCLRSNGIDIGHMVSMLRLAPWRMPCDMVAGVEYNIMILRAGDITGSEDLSAALRAGKCRIEYDADNGQHHYVDEHGKRWNPKLPFIGADY